MTKRLGWLFLVGLCALVFFAPARAAQCTNLPDSPYCDSDNYAGCCGPNPTSVSTSTITETGVSATITKESDAESVYACVHLSSVTPTDTEIREGLASTCKDTGVIHDGTGTVNFTGANAFTGLSANTAYKVSAIADEGTARPIRKVVTSAELTTSAASGGGGGGGDVEITGSDNYFVDCDAGNDSNAGTSMAAPWLTLGKVNSTVTTAGADVYLKHGTTCSGQQLVADWGGVNTSNMATIDCYYDDAGTPRTCSTQVKPIIDGGLALSAFQNGTVDYRSSAYSGNPLSSEHTALVYVTNTGDYTELRYLQIERSRGGGMVFQGTNTAGSLTNVYADQIDINNTGTYAVLVENGTTKFKLTNVHATLGATCEQQRFQSGTSLTEICNYAGWPAGITIVRSANAEGLVYNSSNTKTFTEGFNAYSGTSYVIYYGNKWASTLSNGFYNDFADHIVVENNIGVGSKDTQGYSNVTSTFGGSFTVGGEDVVQAFYDGSENQLFRNNVCVDCGYGTDWGLETNAKADGDQIGAMFVGNTVISSRTADVRLWDTNSAYSEMVLKSNIFWTTDGSVGSCDSNATSVDMNYNVWPSSPSDTDCDGANDTDGTPDLTHSYAGYDLFTADNLPDFDDFELTTSSVGHQDGDPSLETTARMTGSSYGFGLDELLILEPHITSEANWEKALFYCADEVTRSATVPDAGAVCTKR